MLRSAVLAKLDAYARLTRLDKPIGTLLLLWPTLWALWLAARGVPDTRLLVVFILGTLVMRSAGCIINDYADRDFDPHVARTRNRPLATREVSVREALALAAILVIIAFALVLQLNWLTIALSFPALAIAASYPFTKRFFWLPQAYLGIAFGFGIPMAYAAQLGTLTLETAVLLLANIFWTIAYDTEYAMVDRADDLKLGIRTSAILFGRLDVAAVMACYGAFFAIMIALGWHLRASWPYYAGLMVAAALAAHHYLLIRNRDPAACFRAFRYNNWLGAAVFAGIACAR